MGSSFLSVIWASVILRLRKGKIPSGGPWATTLQGSWSLLDWGWPPQKLPPSWLAWKNELRASCGTRRRNLWKQLLSWARLYRQPLLSLSPHQHGRQSISPLLPGSCFPGDSPSFPVNWVDHSGGKHSSNIQTPELFADICSFNTTVFSTHPRGRALPKRGSHSVEEVKHLAVGCWGPQFYSDHENSPHTLTVSSRDPRGTLPATTKEVFWPCHSKYLI